MCIIKCKLCDSGGWTTALHQPHQWRQGARGERPGEEDDPDQGAGDPLPGPVWPPPEGAGEYPGGDDSQETAGLCGQWIAHYQGKCTQRKTNLLNHLDNL